MNDAAGNPTKALDEKFCGECGKAIKAKAEICPNCGVRQLGASNGKNRITAALLAFFLGGFGAHKFYLGRVGQGLLYLIFCWTFIPAIIAFIEFIVLLTMNDESFNQKYGRA